MRVEQSSFLIAMGQKFEFAFMGRQIKFSLFILRLPREAKLVFIMIIAEF